MKKTTMPGMPEVEVVEINPQDRCGKDNCSQD